MKATSVETLRRRDVLIGGGCLAAAGAAYVLEPKQRMSLLGAADLERIIPDEFAGWRKDPSHAVLVPEDENSLASRLYNQVVARLYLHPDHGHAMMLIAYGDTQSDLLQLHRPEACYPAFGFDIVENQSDTIRLGEGVALPSRALIAVGPSRREHITYWVRMGEFMPVNKNEQRIAKLRTQVRGILPDGVLVRISNIGEDLGRAFLANKQFASDMVLALSPVHRAALIGTANAIELRSVRSVGGPRGRDTRPTF